VEPSHQWRRPVRFRYRRDSGGHHWRGPQRCSSAALPPADFRQIPQPCGLTRLQAGPTAVATPSSRSPERWDAA
jgi:hypothetical protein